MSYRREAPRRRSRSSQRTGRSSSIATLRFSPFLVSGRARGHPPAQSRSPPYRPVSAQSTGGTAGAAAGCVSPLPMPMGGAAAERPLRRRWPRPRCAARQLGPVRFRRAPPAAARSWLSAILPRFARTLRGPETADRFRSARPSRKTIPRTSPKLRTIDQNARTAREAGQTDAQVRAIMARAEPIRKALREPEKQLQNRIEATLSAGQLAWMKAHSRPPRGGRSRGRAARER